MVLCSLLPLVSLRLTTTAKQFIRPKLLEDKNRLLCYIDIASAIEFETTTVLELLPKGIDDCTTNYTFLVVNSAAATIIAEKKSKATTVITSFC